MSKGLTAALLAAGLGLGLLALLQTGAPATPANPQASATARSCSVPTAPQSPYPGMVWVPQNTFIMGAEYAYREEGPAHSETVAGFWMDQTEVSNAQFAEFVAATAYLTLAERGISNPDDPEAAPIPGSAIFAPLGEDGNYDPFRPLWQFAPNANWRQPQGPGSDLSGLGQHPVVHIAFEDAQAYAAWKGHSLPTEAQFELAAQSSSRENRQGEQIANTWQGFFPMSNNGTDGFLGTAPVGCYGANALGLFDLIGNVWEWTQSTYYFGHDFPNQQAYPQGYDPNQPGEAVAVIKGGSYLCAPNYCLRYRPEARQGQSKGLGTSHIGFRTVLVPPLN